MFKPSQFFVTLTLSSESTFYHIFGVWDKKLFFFSPPPLSCLSFKPAVKFCLLPTCLANCSSEVFFYKKKQEVQELRLEDFQTVLVSPVVLHPFSQLYVQLRLSSCRTTAKGYYDK